MRRRAMAIIGAVAVVTAAWPAEARQIQGLYVQSGALDGRRPAAEAVFTPRVEERPGKKFAGVAVHVGRGCHGDPYLTDPAGKIALIARGVCRFDNKIARAQRAGAEGVIMYNHPGMETLVRMGGDSTVTLEEGGTVDIAIPAVFVAHSTGTALREAGPVRVQVKDRTKVEAEPAPE